MDVPTDTRARAWGKQGHSLTILDLALKISLVQITNINSYELLWWFRADKRDWVRTGEIPASQSKGTDTAREKLPLPFLRQQHGPDGSLSGIKRETALLHPALSSRARNSPSLQPSLHHREPAFGFFPLCFSLPFPPSCLPSGPAISIRLTTPPSLESL